MADGTLEQVKERTDIVELIGARVKLRQTGRTYKGTCPFHQESTPSFVVYPESQSFYCFGCGKSGDAFSFVMAMDNLTFHDALVMLAERAGVDLQVRATRKDPEQDRVRERLIELNERAAGFFQNALWGSDAGAEAKALLDKRGIDRRTAERFGLGFAPASFDALKKHFTSRDASEDELVDAGLLVRREEDGRTWDRFRNRLTFPIRDREGRTLGFGARAIGDDKPKYLNTAHTAIFDKRSILYCLDKAYDEIRKQRAVVIVEGYMDAIAAHQFGFANVVATMGTAVTANQVSAIRRYVDRVYLALDADAAGQMATLRGIDALRDSFTEESRPEVKPMSPVRFERTIGAEIRIVVIPHGKDPDELIRSDVEAWRRALDTATPLVEYYLTQTLATSDATPSGRARALEEIAVPLLREISDATIRAQYVGLTSRLLGIKDNDVHAAVLRTTPVRRPVARASGVRAVERPVAADPERYLVALLLRYPRVGVTHLEQIDPQDLLEARHRELLSALAGSGGDTQTLLELLPPELAEYAQQLTRSVLARPDHSPGLVARDIVEAIGRLQRARYDFRVTQVQSELREASASGDVQAVAEHIRHMDLLAKRKSIFDPRVSPYFRDTRSSTLN